MFELVDFGEFELGLMYLLYIIPLFFTVRHVGPCRICRLAPDIFLVVYIYIYMLVAANFVLQVAVVVSVFILFICFVSDFWDQMNLIC